VSSSVDLLIVAAFAPELDPLVPPLAVNGVAEHGGRTIATHAIGIGLAQACAGLARAFDRFSPRAVLLVGSCGLHPGAPGNIADILVARSLALTDAPALDGLAAFPAPLATERSCDPALVEALVAAGARAARVANTLAITTDDALAQRYQRAGLDAEHLEAFALEILPREIPCAALLAIANRVGSNARDEWRTHAHRAHRALAALLLPWLGAGAPGVPPR
jgi:nucleoside phosphorylase